MGKIEELVKLDEGFKCTQKIFSWDKIGHDAIF